jgi:hypothetical protein
MKTHKEILTTYGEVTAGRFAELLVAAVLRGKVVHQVGYDIECSDGRRVEVRSRVEGTDGDTPRVTLNDAKMELCTDVIAIRFSSRYQPIEARLVRRVDLEPLYLKYRQKKGIAHINWARFCASPGAQELLPQVLKAFAEA